MQERVCVSKRLKIGIRAMQSCSGVVYTKMEGEKMISFCTILNMVLISCSSQRDWGIETAKLNKRLDPTAWHKSLNQMTFSISVLSFGRWGSQTSLAYSIGGVLQVTDTVEIMQVVLHACKIYGKEAPMTYRFWYKLIHYV